MTPTNASDIVVLLRKQLGDELSAEESLLLQQWQQASPHNQELFDTFAAEERFKVALKDYMRWHESVPAAGWQTFRDRYLEPAPPPVPALHRRLDWWKLTALAAILASVVLLTWWWTGNKASAPVAPQPPAITSTVPAIPPGQDGAVLTLANGQQIVLDKAADGRLAGEGNSTVTRAGGLISYKAEAGAKEAVVQHTMHTPRGRQYKVQLSDGSSIFLNAASSVTYPTQFTGGTRSVTITGEAYVNVAHGQQPFIVHLPNGIAVEVMGTQFVVSAYADEAAVRTTLVQGSVKVTTHINNRPVQQVLEPRQQARVRADQVQVIKEANVEEATAFVHGFFYFHQSTIREVMAKLEKWYDITVVFEGPVSNRTFEGEIERNLPLNVVLDILRRNGVTFTVTGNQVVVQ